MLDHMQSRDSVCDSTTLAAERTAGGALVSVSCTDERQVHRLQREDVSYSGDHRPTVAVQLD